MKYRWKNSFKGIIKLIVFLLILFMCLEVTYSITKRKESYEKFQDFFSQKEDFNVLFFGSSRPMNGIFPMELWNNYGIVSYNMAATSETSAVTYYNMRLALEHTKPDLIVIDASLAKESNKISADSEKFMHNSYDAYPISYTKYLAIKDLFGDEDILDKTMEYLFNFSIYHSRWDELSKKDFKIESKYKKGAEYRINVAVPKAMSDFDSIKMYDGEEHVGIQYFRKFIEYCQENGIEVLAIDMPYRTSDYNVAVSKYFQVICDQYNINYINFLSMNIVNYNTDLYDETSHLNPSGARKVTDYLGRYIIENYDIKDQRFNKDYSFWYDDYNEYVEFKINNLKNNRKNLNNYLMLLYGEKDINYDIRISSEKDIEKDKILMELLENLENNYKIDDEVFKDRKEKTVRIMIWDNKTGKLIDTVWW